MSGSWGYTFLKVAAVAVAGALVAALSSSSAASELGVPFGAQREDKERDDESWGSTFMTVVGAVGAVAAAATVADGLIALLSSTASAASSALQVLIGAPRHNQAPLQVNNEKWKKPEIDWLKLNVDGSRDHNEPSAGCGGVLRDSSGKWILGFSMKLDPIINDQTHKTELQAILTGLELTREMNVKKLVVESDSESAVSMVESGLGFKFQRSEFDIVQRIRKLRFDPEWQVKLVCVPRKANRVANWLAKDARKLSCNDLCKYHSAPGNCSQLVSEDTVGF